MQQQQQQKGQQQQHTQRRLDYTATRRKDNCRYTQRCHSVHSGPDTDILLEIHVCALVCAACAALTSVFTLVGTRKLGQVDFNYTKLLLKLAALGLA